MRFFLPSVEFPRWQPDQSRRRTKVLAFLGEVKAEAPRLLDRPASVTNRRHLGRALDRRIRENVEVVAARRGELRDDRSFLTGLEPVPGVRRDRVLVTRAEHDRLALDVQLDGAATTAERLFLAGGTVERWVPVLRAGLARVEHELLGAVAVRVDVDEQLQADLSQPAEAEVGDLDLGALTVRQLDSRGGELIRGVGLGGLML